MSNEPSESVSRVLACPAATAILAMNAVAWITPASVLPSSVQQTTSARQRDARGRFLASPRRPAGAHTTGRLVPHGRMTSARLRRERVSARRLQRARCTHRTFERERHIAGRIDSRRQARCSATMAQVVSRAVRALVTSTFSAGLIAARGSESSSWFSDLDPFTETPPP